MIAPIKPKKKLHDWLCSHYKRRCFLQAPCCKPGTFYPCRICHDEKSGHEIGLHRFEITKIKCATCNHVQELGGSCVKCKECFGDYFCGDCRLWSTDREIYHCDGCKLCRIGKREYWKHCDRCNACYETDYYEAHICTMNKLETTCPICREYMFDSRKQISFMLCGHAIHEECLDVMIIDRHQFSCPSCRTLIVKVLDPVIESQSVDGTPTQIRLGWPVVDLHMDSLIRHNTLFTDELVAERIKCRLCANRVLNLKQLVEHHSAVHSPKAPTISKNLKLREEDGEEKRTFEAKVPGRKILLQLKSVEEEDLNSESFPSFEFQY